MGEESNIYYSDDFQNPDKLYDFLQSKDVSASEYENLSEDEKYNFAIQKAMEFYDKENEKFEDETSPFVDGGATVLKGSVEYNADVEDLENTNALTYAQSAMYKDELSDSASEFFENVQNNFDNYKKAKYQFKNAKLSIPADTIRHDDKHELSANDWQEIEDNIENIYIANKVNDKSAFGDNLYNFGIKTQNGDYYYLCVAINNKDNYIVTAVKNTKRGVDSYVTGKGKTLAKVPNALPPVAPFSQVSSNNIINYLKENFKPKELANPNIQDNFGQSVEELQEMFSEDIKNILAENEINSDEFEIEDVRLYGSYTTSKNKDTSDLDVIVQYKGSMKEDTAFNILNDAKLTITDVNGIERKIDINPINSQLSGSIDEHIERMQEIDGAYFQPAYHGSPVKFDKFDHDYIGSGEGAQIHGYGTYVAESKHIADERYRERLVENKSAIEVGGDVYYANDNGSWSSQDGEEYWDSDTYYGYVLDVFNRTEDKEKSIKWLQDDLDEVLADKKEFVEENGLDGKLLEINSDNGFVNDGGEEYFDAIDEYLQRELGDYDDRISTYMRAVEVLKENDIKMYQGQLYEVEIPEDEEMLDEDLPLSEQPQKVQDAFGEMIKADQNGQLILLDSDMDESETPTTSLSVDEIVSENPNGKKIYDRISSTIADVYGVDYAEADKLASELLNRYGIKGIKYNGQIDGQCYVIFNPENIDITRTFYQEGVNQNDNNSISKYSNYEDLVADYSGTFEDVPNDYDINVLDAALKDLGIDKNHPQKIETPNGNVLVTAKTIEHIINREDDKTRYKSINKMFATLKNPTFVNVSKNGGMYYFKIFKTNGGTKNQTVVVRTNELGEVVETTYPTKRDNNYFEKLKIGKTVYDVKNQRRKGDNNTAPVNNSIANNSTNNNPKRTGYVFQEPAQPNLFVENAAQNHNKGFVGIDLKGNRGAFVRTNNLILVATTGDVSTVIHESAHAFLDTLCELEGTSQKYDDALFAIRKTLKNDGTPFTRSQHEKFAKYDEGYTSF